MPTTLRLPRLARSRQILDAATLLFAHRGLNGTTTREIARLAEVNEALIFRHFPSKEALYWAVLDAKRKEVDARGRLQRALRSASDERKALAAVAEDILRRHTGDGTLMRLIFFSALEKHRLAERYFASFGDTYVDDLARYVRARIRAGRLRKVHPRLAARAFLGTVIYRFLLHEFFGGKRRERLDIPKASDELASFWLEGMRKH